MFDILIECTYRETCDWLFNLFSLVVIYLNI